MRFQLLCCLLLLVPFQLIYPQLEAPLSVPQGSPFEITWTGTETLGRLAILEKTENGYRRVGSWIYLHNRSTVFKAKAPLDPGPYFIGQEVEGRLEPIQPLTVRAIAALIDAPTIAGINEAIEIAFEGPSYGDAVIGIYKETEMRDERFSYAYPSNSGDGTVTLKAPLDPGSYQIKYKLGSISLASSPLTVGGVAATLKGPDRIQAGSEVIIQWQGPFDPQNTIGFVEPGGEKRAGDYRYLHIGSENAVRLNAPVDSGKYEVAFFVRSKVISRHPIVVEEATATLMAPETVEAHARFDVEWTGPGNRSDRIELRDEEDARTAVAYVRTDASRVTLRAPQEGNYTLQYRTKEGRILGQKSLSVLPLPSQPGFLEVSAGVGAGLGENTVVEVILDASGSMLQREGNLTRIDIAKSTLVSLLGETIPAGTPFALRVFGHLEADPCSTHLEIPLSPLEVSAARQQVQAIMARSRSRTPLADSLLKTREDLAGADGERILILLTDGKETCNGDPLQAIDLLQSDSENLRVNIVGFAINDEDLQETFQSWAALGHGLYLNARDAEQLFSAMRRVLEVPFTIRDGDAVVATGMTGGEALTLPAGKYQLHYNLDGKANIKRVQVISERLTRVDLP
jgi:hypothetical protein